MTPRPLMPRPLTPRTRLAVIAAAVVGIAVLVVAVVLVATAPSPSPSPAVPSASAPVAIVSPSITPTVPSAPGSPGISPGPPVPPVPPPPPATCAPFDPQCSRLPISGATAAFTSQLSCGTLGPCTLDLDVYYPRATSATPAPSASGPARSGPWPVLVAVPGGPEAPGIRHGLGDFASLLSSQGAVVFVADYREGAQFGGTFPLPYEDIGCAIRYARAHAAQYGGDPSKVTLVAHSLGGFFASTEALSSDPFTPAPGACVTTSGSTKPDAFIGIAGIYSQSGITPGFLDAFFGGPEPSAAAGAPGNAASPVPGGSAGATGAAGGNTAGGSTAGGNTAGGSAASLASDWAAGNPFALVQAHSNPGLVVHLIQGANDMNVRPIEAQTFEQALQAASYNATLTMIPDADHNSVLQNPETIQAIMQTVLALGGQAGG